ncbi:MAG: hypothetical protein OER91_07335 [Gammaproteobacteria bacterium]|nr:hypothetical protein [Gammaproteobacteria bacterium]
MSSYKSIERMTFLSRQLADIADDGSERSALARLKDACQGQYATEMADLEQILGSQAGEEQSSRAQPYRILPQLLREVPGRKVTLLRGFVDYLRQSRTVFDTYWEGVAGTFAYLATLAAMLAVVSVVFGLWTIPSFERMFTEFGAELPALTAAVFKYGAGVPIVAIVTLAIIVFVAWFAITTIRRMKSLEPLPAWPHSMPLFGSVARSYNQLLLLNFARLLMESGVSQDDAIRVAARETGQPETLGAELAIAAKLGNLRNEITRQCEERLDSLALAMVGARDRFALFLKIAIYSLVAVLVIAMYLPIFRLGSVI